MCMSCDARSVSRPLVRRGLLQMKVAAAERPQEIDNDPNYIVAICLSSHGITRIKMPRS